MMKEDAEPSPSVAIPEGSPSDTTKPTTTTSSNKRRIWLLGGGILLVVAAVLCITLPLTLGKDNDSNSNKPSSSSNVLLGERVGQGNNNNNGNGSDELPLFTQDITRGYNNPEELEAALTVALKSQAASFISDNLKTNNGGGTGDEGPAREQEMMEESSAMPPTSAGGETAMMDQAASGADGAGAASTTEGVTDFETNNQEENVDEADIIKADANFIYAAYGDYIVVWNTDGQKVAQVPMPPIDTQHTIPSPVDPPVSATTTTTTVQDAPNTTTSKQTADASYIPWTPKPYINSMLLTDNHLVVMVSGYNDRWYYDTAQQQAQEQYYPILYGYRALQIRLYRKTTTGDLTFVGSKDINGNYVDARSIGDVVHIACGSGVDTWTHLWEPLQRYHFQQEGSGITITDDEYVQQATAKAEDLIPELARKLRQEIQLSDAAPLPTMLQVNQWMTTDYDQDTTTTTTTTGDSGTASDAMPGFQMPFGAYDVVSNVGQVTSFNVNDGLDANGELTTTSSAFMAPSYFSTLYGTETHLVMATSGWDWNPSLQETIQTTYLVALEINDDGSTSFLTVGSLPGNLLNSYALDIVDNELRAATTVQHNTWWWGGPRPMPMDTFAVESVAAQAETVTVEATATESTEKPATSEADPLGLCPPIDGNCVTEDNYDACIGFVQKGCTSITIAESCPVIFGCDLYDDQAVAEPDPLGLCPTMEEDPDCVNEDNYQQCVNFVQAGCTDIYITEGSCPLEFDCLLPTDPATQSPTESEESRTENYMIVMLLTPGLMTEKGRVQIGEKDETITAVRFFNNIAYAVTFERTDPFYVLDMSVPKVLGELKLPGFSSYLHSMNADNTLLLAVGQDATEDGRVTGLMVTVFDATNPANPVTLQSHTFETSDSAWSSSEILFDYKAFRYVDGKLIMPMDIWYNQVWNEQTQQLDPLPDGVENFQGFAVMAVSTTNISELYRISHMRQPGTCSYCSGYLPTRSFVYSGELMTVRENQVVGTVLNTGEELWRLNLSIDGEVNECCW